MQAFFGDFGRMILAAKAPPDVIEQSCSDIAGLCCGMWVALQLAAVGMMLVAKALLLCLMP